MSNFDIYDDAHGRGGMREDYWERDPRRLGFVLARYKFVGRMFEGRGRVLEVGCADGFASRVVRQHVGHLTAIDTDPRSIAEAQSENWCETWTVEFRQHDLLAAPLRGYHAAFALDVLEHLHPVHEERRFLMHLRESAPLAIIGMPSLESQPYASALSKAGHINCKSGHGLKEALYPFWSNIFLFSMSDETVHTGFAPMAHYRLALCTP